MATTRSQMRTLFRKEVRIDPNGIVWDDTTANTFFEQARLRLQSDGQFNWPENQGQTQTITTTAGTEQYAQDSTLGRYTLVMFDTIELYPTEFENAKRANPQDTQGKPVGYYLSGSNVGIYPIPDGTHTIKAYFRQRFAELTADSGTGGVIIFPDSMAPCMAKYMAYLAWSQPRGNKATANEKLEEYKAMLEEHKNTYLVKDTADLSKNYVVPRRRRGLRRGLSLPANLNKWL